MGPGPSPCSMNQMRKRDPGALGECTLACMACQVCPGKHQQLGSTEYNHCVCQKGPQKPAVRAALLFQATFSSVLTQTSRQEQDGHEETE